jgi:hypothetical protein
VEALLLAAEAHQAALLPTSALPYALSALHHARRLSLDLMAARAVVALAGIWLALGALPDVRPQVTHKSSHAQCRSLCAHCGCCSL